MSFVKSLITAVFQNIVTGFAFAIIYCLQKEKVGKKKVLERSSFDNFFQAFHLQVAPSQLVVNRN